MANRNNIRIRVGGRVTLRLLDALLAAGMPLAGEAEEENINLLLTVESALRCVEAHPHHLLVFASQEGVIEVEALLDVLLAQTEPPFHVLSDSEGTTQAFPSGLRCNIDRDGHPVVYGSQLRELRRLLTEGKAGLALAHLNECAPEIPPLPPFELTD